jgi:predicted phage terminase large subunit-like protein
VSESLLEQLNLSDARRSFAGFMSRIDIPGTLSLYRREEERFIKPPREMPKHIEIAGKAFDLALSGEIERLMLFWPPGTAKSTTASVCLPAYAMGKFPEYRALTTSHGAKLAWQLSRRARNICRSEAYRKIWGVAINRETRAVDEWALSNGSEMVAAAIDGVVGRRGQLVIYDDPFANRKKAESPGERLKVRHAIEDDLDSRLIPGGCMIGMFTRYVMDDPATWFLGEDYKGQSGWIKGTDGRRYFVLNCPAQAELEDDPLGRAPGEYIWPERFPESFWAPHKLIERKWSSLYQQRPAPRAGLIFKRQWFTLVRPDDVPKLAHRCRGWDWAASSEEENPGANATSGTKIARNGDRLWIQHNVNAKCSAGDIDKIFVQQVKADGPGCIVSIPQDPGQAGKDQAKRRAQMAINAGASDVRVSPEYGGKIYRADTLAGEAEKGNVFVVMGDWQYQRFIDQLCDFPVGKEDDDVDSAARACNELVQSVTMGRFKAKVG